MLGYKIEFNLAIDKSIPTSLVVELRPCGLVWFSVYELGAPKYLFFGKHKKLELHRFATGQWNDFTQEIESLDLNGINDIRAAGVSVQLLRQCTMIVTFAQEISAIATEELKKLIHKHSELIAKKELSE
jgi:hypothetical protein